ncbi:hypothetical protein COCNU_scaffold008643G000030 [Cocos nucifera]|nr:hypothetical protein [Cocos nucifera]
MLIAGQPYFDPIGSGLSSSYNGVYGIPSTNNVYLNVMNYMNGAAQTTMDITPMASTESFPAYPSGVPSIHTSRNQAAYGPEFHPRTVGGLENPMATNMSFGELPENLTITDL